MSGKLTAAIGVEVPAAIATHAVKAGTGNECEVIVITGNQVYEVEYTGTPDAGFVVGLENANIDGTGTKLAADATTPAGAVAIIKMENGKCQVIFKERQLS